jgi:hypothetical protein
MNRSFRYLSLIGALPVTNAFYFNINSKTLTCNGDPFTETVFTHLCVEPEFYGEEQFYGPICYWGDHVMISGSVIAVSNFPTNGQVVVIPEFLSWQRYNSEDMQAIGRVCEVLVPLENQTCGEPGQYGMDLKYLLPSKPESWYQSLLDSVTSITIHFENTFTCDEVKTSHNLAMSQDTGMSLGVAFGALFAVWNGKRRRRRIQQQNEGVNGGDSDDGKIDRYVEMSDQPMRNTTGDDPVAQWRRCDSVVDAMEQHKVIYGDDMVQPYFR